MQAVLPRTEPRHPTALEALAQIVAEEIESRELFRQLHAPVSQFISVPAEACCRCTDWRDIPPPACCAQPAVCCAP